MAELNRKRELNAAAEVKRGELALAKRYAHQARLAAFLRTAAAPRLFWQPARHCADTILLQEQAQLDLSVWLVRACMHRTEHCKMSCLLLPLLLGALKEFRAAGPCAGWGWAVDLLGPAD
jgi:hypothetical protein